MIAEPDSTEAYGQLQALYAVHKDLVVDLLDLLSRHVREMRAFDRSPEMEAVIDKLEQEYCSKAREKLSVSATLSQSISESAPER